MSGASVGEEVEGVEVEVEEVEVEGGEVEEVEEVEVVEVQVRDVQPTGSYHDWRRRRENKSSLLTSIRTRTHPTHKRTPRDGRREGFGLTLAADSGNFLSKAKANFGISLRLDKLKIANFQLQLPTVNC